LIEVIVVVVILAVLAAVIAPRIISPAGQQTRASALAIGELVSAAARRDTLTSQRIALDFDRDKQRLTLMTLVTSTGDTPTTEWREDRLIRHVDLIADTRLEEALADGVALDAKGWRVEFPQGGRRPALELVFSDPFNKEHWRVELPSGAFHAAVHQGQFSDGVTDQSIDLDATGGGTAPW
jgi:type II secretory pathway pseudopilin PulG